MRKYLFAYVLWATVYFISFVSAAFVLFFFPALERKGWMVSVPMLFVVLLHILYTGYRFDKTDQVGRWLLLWSLLTGVVVAWFVCIAIGLF